MAKTYEYIIVLKKNSSNRVDMISQLMLLLSLIGFIGTAITHPNNSIRPILMSLLIVGWWIFCYLQQKRNIAPSYRLALLFAAIGWYFQKDGLWIAFIYLMAALLEKQVKFPQEIAFDEEEIVFNSFPKKRHQWNELNNAVLKDGILTLDFKNNRIFQKEVNAEVSAEIEKEFTQFAQKLITPAN
jgi:hypothetical protein